jgi:SRSO17 transposase
LEGVAVRFMEFTQSFTELFRSYRHDVSEKARQYLKGLMQAGTRKNMERMAEVVPESDQQALQQFLSASRWDARAVMDQVAGEADQHLGDEEQAGLLFDETSFQKKGKRSVGVARQYLGRLGKVDNGQVAVFAALSRGSWATAVDTRLYLPEEWTRDRKRCQQAGIPVEPQAFKTKPELMLEMVAHARQLGLRFGWVGADAGYGADLELMFELERRGECFLIDVHKNQMIYLKDPAPAVPLVKGISRGRKPSKAQPTQPTVRVDQLSGQASNWKRIRLRDSTKGPLTVEVHHRRVWVWDAQRRQVHCWHLMVRRDPQTQEDYKFSLSNASPKLSTQQLAARQSQRFWIERVFEDGKSEVGMADYQVQGWLAWHHHMALVMMAMLFMLTERLRQRKQFPLLSCADIESLLAHFLPRRDTTKQEVLGLLIARHKKRQKAINSHTRNASRRGKRPRSKVTK